LSESHQQFIGQHPEYYWKWLAYQRPWYAGQIEAQPLPIVPARQPTEPIVNNEQLMRMIQATARINPDGQKAVHVPPEPAYVSGIQPTNPEIIERLVAYGEVGQRPWYAEPWIPYVGYPMNEPRCGIKV
jgi:hypothetical protein